MGQEGLVKKLSRNVKTGLKTLWTAFSSQAENPSLGNPIRDINQIQINSVPEIFWVSTEHFDDMGRCEDGLQCSPTCLKNLLIACQKVYFNKAGRIHSGLESWWIKRQFLVSPEHFEDMETRCEDGLPCYTASPKNLLSIYEKELSFNYSEMKFRREKEPMPDIISVNKLQKKQKDTPGWEKLRDIVLPTSGEEGQIGKFSRLLGSRVNALWETILSQAGVTFWNKPIADMNLLRGNSSELVLISSEALLDDIERSEDRMPPCPLNPEGWPNCRKLKDCLSRMDQEFWSDIDENWYYEKFPWKKECCDKKIDSFVDRNDDPTANGLL